MKRFLLIVSVALATFVLQGCMGLHLLSAASIGANAAAADTLGKSSAQRQADKCYEIELSAEKAKLTPA